MPAFLWLIVDDYAETPGKFEGVNGLATPSLFLFIRLCRSLGC